MILQSSSLMRKQILMPFISMLIFSSPTFATEILIAVGATEKITRPISRVWVQDRSVLEVESLGNGIRLKGIKPGATIIRLNDQETKVQVIPPGTVQSLKTVKEHLKKIIGLQADVTNQGIILTGTLFQFSDWLSIQRLAADQNIKYLLKARFIDEKIEKNAETEINTELKNRGLKPMNLLFSRGVLAKINPQSNQFEIYKECLESWGVEIIKDPAALEMSPTVKVEITIAEVNSSFARNIGISPPTSAQATILFGEGGISFEPGSAKANFFEAAGNGKILASPNLICKSDNEAEFWAGGEIPIQLISFRRHEITWRKYGILLKVKPKADSSGHINLKVETEVTNIDQSKAIDSIPAFSTNKVSTNFDMRKPGIIVLSGLVRNDQGDSSTGLAGLSRIPILGHLFSSKDFNERKTELLILLKPTILIEDDDTNPTLDKTAQHLSQ